MKLQPVKTAIVGCGMVSDIYLQNAISRFSILEVAGCCDVDLKLAELRAGQYGIKAMTMAEIQADLSIEMVINLTNPAAHYAVIKELLLAGKHVYTEKILALSFAEGAELVRLAEEKGLYLGSAPDTFLGSGLQTARGALDAGIIGEVTSCAAVLNRDNHVGAEVIPYLARVGGGIAYDVGIYYLAALCFLLGPVREVAGFMSTRASHRLHRFPGKENFGQSYEMECETLCAASLVFADGAYGNVQFNSECIMNPFPVLTLHGTQGIMYLPDPDGFGGEVKILRRGHAEPFVFQQNHGYSQNSRGLGAAEMAWAMRTNRPARADKWMALHALEILDGIKYSAQNKNNTVLKTTFKRPEPLPQGYLSASQFADFPADEEAALAF